MTVTSSCHTGLLLMDVSDGICQRTGMPREAAHDARLSPQSYQKSTLKCSACHTARAALLNKVVGALKHHCAGLYC